jgi:hypothetical protein
MTTSTWQGRLKKLSAKVNADKNHLLNRIVLFEKSVTERKPLSTWKDFQGWFSPFQSDGWFRGQSNAKWNLSSTLDRKVWRSIVYDKNSSSWGPVNLRENEKALLSDFQRGAHRYHEDTPPVEDKVDWFAMMQHYGAPTRLLDWTRSPYVALYFALHSCAVRASAGDVAASAAKPDTAIAHIILA